MHPATMYTYHVYTASVYYLNVFIFVIIYKYNLYLLNMDKKPDKVDELYRPPKKEFEDVVKGFDKGKINEPVLPAEISIFKRFWKFLKEDSWQSLIVNLILAFVIIKFVLFPLASLVTGTALPLVIVESCSMYHSGNLEDVLSNSIYSDYNINIDNTSSWSLRNGFSKGDIIFVVGPKDLKVGDIIIFNAGQNNPIILSL